MDSKSVLWVGVMSLACTSLTSNAGEFTDVRPLISNYSENGYDYVSITPLINWIDTNADSSPEKIKMAFNVWDVGTKTKVLQTEKRTVTMPVVPCINPTWVDSDFRIAFMGAGGANSPVQMLLEVEASCGEEGGEERTVYKTIWYRARIIGDGSSVVRTWKDWEVIGTETETVFLAGGDRSDFQLILGKESASGDGSKIRMIFIDYIANSADSTVVADETYDMEYFNY